MSHQLNYADGTAAIAAVESLLISLRERNLISHNEIQNLLGDAVEALRNEGVARGNAENTDAAIDVLQRIMRNTNGVRRGPEAPR